MWGERFITEVRGQRSEDRGQEGRRTEDGGRRGRRADDGGLSWSSAMLRQLDYLHRAVIRFLKETADGLNRVSNHLFRYFGKDRQR